jgi:hypothetical protein
VENGEEPMIEGYHNADCCRDSLYTNWFLVGMMSHRHHQTLLYVIYSVEKLPSSSYFRREAANYELVKGHLAETPVEYFCYDSLL